MNRFQRGLLAGKTGQKVAIVRATSPDGSAKSWAGNGGPDLFLADLDLPAFVPLTVFPRCGGGRCRELFRLLAVAADRSERLAKNACT